MTKQERVMTTESELRDDTEIGNILLIFETAASVLAALIYKDYVDSGMTPKQAMAAITSNPHWIAASKIFGPIGAAATGLATVYEATANGGNVDDFLEAAGNVLVGFVGAAFGTALVVALLGTAPLSITAMLAATVAALLAQIIVDEVIEPLIQTLIDLFNIRPVDPLVIDLDGDGIELIALEDSTAFFEFDNDGFLEHTDWVAPDDALLAMDRNHNGSIDDLSELFGSDTIGGFADLAKHDSDGNGVINADDAVYQHLLLWQDLNGNGQSEAGELRTLAAHGIASINLTVQAVHDLQDGNGIFGLSTVTLANGSTRAIGEVLFDTSQSNTRYILPEGFTYDADVIGLPWLRGLGNVKGLAVAMTENDALKAEAKALINQARSGDYTAVLAGFDDFLADWAGVSDAKWLDQSAETCVFMLKDIYGVPKGYIFIDETNSAYQQFKHIAGFAAFDVLGMTHSMFSDAMDEAFPGWTDLLIENNWTLVGYSGAAWAAKEFPVTYVTAGGGSPSPYPQYRDVVHLEYGDLPQTYSTSGPVRFGTATVTTAAADAPPMGAGMSAEHMAFLQKIMGQSFRVSDNVIASEGLLPFSLTATEAVNLEAAFDKVQDYMPDASLRFGLAITRCRRDDQLNVLM
jgi:hypothetical protein